MSTHPSLKSNSGSAQTQSVLKRLEKILQLLKKDTWKEGDSVFHLPKVKVLKFKVKKEKTKAAEDTAAAEGTAAGAAPAAPAAQKSASDKTAGKK